MSSIKLNENIFQIYIQDNENLEIPENISTCIATIKEKSNNFNYFLLGKDSLRAVINENLGTEARDTYDKLKPYAYKADFGRQCLLYLFGGWYFDSTVKLNSSLFMTTEYNLVVFKDAPNPGLPSWDLSNSVIFGHSGAPIFEMMIKQIIMNAKNEFYGITPLSPTGPTLFGRCLATLGENKQTLTGMLSPLTPNHYKKNYAFILPDGTIFAWGKSSWGTPQGDGLIAFNSNGTNSYSEMYHKREIY